jgi:hypothetical protein
MTQSEGSSSFLMFVTRCGFTAGRFRLCAERLLQAVTIFLTLISVTTLRWLNGFSGQCLISCESFRRDLPPDVAIKD